MEKKITSEKVASSLIYKFIEKFSAKAVGLLISVILARLLDPNDFGVLAIIMAVVAIAQSIVDSGFSTALVQAKDVDALDYSTVFIISLGLAGILYSLLFFLAPQITNFYNIPNYITQFRIVLLIVFLYSFSSVQNAILARNLRFRAILVTQLVSSIVSGILGIGLAIYGFGIWALTAYYLTHSLISCICYGLATKWIPSLRFSFSKAKKLFSFGFFVFLSGLLTSIFTNIRTFIIGKIYSSDSLGYYSRGEQIPAIISTTIDSSFNAVMLPVFSKYQDDKERIHDLLRKTIRLNSYLNFPAMLGLAAIAPALIEFVYTSKWNPCIPFLQVLSLANLTVSIMPTCLVAIKSLGKGAVILKLETLRRITMLVILCISLLFHSLLGIAVGWFISTIVDVFIIMIPTRKIINYKYRELLSDTIGTLCQAILMFVIVSLIGKLDIYVGLLLILQIILGASVYLITSIVLKKEEFYYLVNVVKNLVIHRKT